MQLGTQFKIDDFVFPIPPKDSLDFNMDRSIAKLEFPGGPPVYQDMGMGEKTLELSGSFTGADALLDNDRLETLWWNGKEMQLSYGDIQKRVRIQNYKPKIRRNDRVDYTLSLIICFPEDQLLDLSNVQGQSFVEAAAHIASADPEDIDKTLDRTYTVKSGDTLWAIAAKSDVYGDGTMWETLAKGNNITDEYSLQVGQVIKIPSGANVQASLAVDKAVTEKIITPLTRAEFLRLGEEVGLVSS